MAIPTSSDEALLLLKSWKGSTSPIGVMLFTFPHLILHINDARVEEIDETFLRLRGVVLNFQVRLTGITFEYLESRELPPDPLGNAPKFDKCLRLILPDHLVIVIFS